MQSINLELKDILDPTNNLKTQELRAIELFFFAESQQVYKQIREVLAVRLSGDIKAVVQKLGSIEKLKYLHPQDTKGFMRALYVELMMGHYLGRLHILRQAGEEKEFSNLVGSFEIPFEEAIRFMRSFVPMTREEYDRLSQELKFRAFTIARVFSLDVINKIKERYIKAIEKGETVSDVMQFLDETLEKIGISERNPYWLEVHARNNFLTAYNAGRWTQIAKAKTVKYLVYNAILDERTTKLCKSLDGVVRPKDDPFWDRFMPPNHHNCYSEDTEVLTNEGWKLFKDLKGDELFVSINPETWEIEYVPAKKLISYYYRGKMIHFKARNFDLLVTPDHNVAYVSSWKAKAYTKKGKTPPIELRPASEVADSDLIPRTGIWKGKDIPFVRISNYEFPTEDFMEFLGWYLAEGSIVLKGKRHWQMKIAQEKPEHVKEIFELCSRLFEGKFNVNLWQGGVFISGTDKEFFRFFKSLGKSYEKFIPAEFKELAPKYLRRLLDAFLKGDGTVYNIKELNKRKGGKWIANFRPYKVYFTSSKRLADDISELILKCGKLPVIYENRLKEKGKKVKFKNGEYEIKHPTFAIGELNSKNFVVHKKGTKSAKRNVLEVDYEGMVYCVELERNHILYVRRNGKCTWSGNCRSLATVVKNEFAYLKRIKSTSRKKIEKLEKLIEEDKQLKREFQFRASPVKSLTGIPPSVFERAKEYGLVEEFLMFNVKTKLWDKIIKELKKKSLPEWKIEHHEEDWIKVWKKIPSYSEYKRMIKETLENPEEKVSLFHFKKGEGSVKVADIFGKRFNDKWFAVWIREEALYTAHPVKDWNKFIEGLGRLGYVKWQ